MMLPLESSASAHCSVAGCHSQGQSKRNEKKIEKKVDFPIQKLKHYLDLFGMYGG